MRSEKYAVFVVSIAIITMACGAVLVSQRQRAALLRVKLAELRFERAETEVLQAENLRLRALQIPQSELEALRADHAALPRLRADLEALIGR